ncbi:MAG: hypothetical protein KC983_00450, partial [Phycisphaerales bacterium]|nr:hypothetical protein [Phycisphaerales bacterium]
FHEAMNLAGLFDIPVIYVVENNGYSMGTSIERGTTMAHDLSVKAKAYGIDHAVVDGMDVINTYNGMKPLVDNARRTSRPCFVDMRTYRFKGHSMSDPRKYRTREEEERFESEDPIDKLVVAMKACDELDEAAYKALQKDVRNQVREAVTWAEASPEPDPSKDLYEDVYMEKFGPYTGTSMPEMLKDKFDRP